MGYLANYSPLGFNLVREVFIETGTYQGTTLKLAAKAGYQELHSIECAEPLYHLAEPLFKDDPKVHLHCGSSPVVLPKIMDGAKTTLFWLDAHWCGQNLAGYVSVFDPAYGQCPLLAELKAIMDVDWKVPPYILIDDAQQFTRRRFGVVFEDKQWPTINQIRAEMPGFTLSEWSDILFFLPDGVSLGPVLTP